METIILTIDDKTLDVYNRHYFSEHPKARKSPIKHPYHPSLNEWMIMKRPMMNDLKSKWKEFIKWFVEAEGYSNLRISRCDMTFYVYYGTNRRHDDDNANPKFILDGIVAGGMLVDDDSKHLECLSIRCGVDTERPRTEIEIKVYEKGENNE